jgi:hypothetical protein
MSPFHCCASVAHAPPICPQEPALYVSARLIRIDFAASEYTKHTQTSGVRLKEASEINKLLMALGQLYRPSTRVLSLVCSMLKRALSSYILP